MMANYKIVDFIDIMQHLIGKFVLKVSVQMLLAKKDINRNLGYNFISD